MKKLFLNYALLVMMSLCTGVMFTSCSDDEDEPKGDDLVEQLQGTWKFELMKMDVLGKKIEMDIDDIRDNSDADIFYDEVLSFSGQKVNGSAYTIQGNKILLPWYKELGWWMSVSFSGSKMTLYMDVEYEGVPIKLWATYKKSGSRLMEIDDVAPEHSIISKAIATFRQ